MPWHLLGSVWVLAFAMTAPMFCVPPMEHILKEELLLTHAQTSLLFSVPILMLVILAIPGGVIADRVSAKNAAGMGAIMIAVGALLRSTATSTPSLLTFTFIYGIGFGLTFPNLPKLISAWCPREKAGIATGIFVTGTLTGVALTTATTIPLVFPITNTFQGVFLIWSIPPVAAAILWWTTVRESPPNRPPAGPTNTERTPLRQILTNKSLWLIAVFMLAHNTFFFTWMGWAPSMMMLKGATPQLAGLIASAAAWVPIPTLLLIPRLAYKLGRRKPFIWTSALATTLLAWGTIYANLPLSWLVMALVGIAQSTRFVFVLALPIEMRPAREVGVASGLILSVGFIGGLAGPWLAGHILDLTGSLDLSLLFLAGISAIMTVLGLRLPETGPKARAT
jgi:CP family cyanate transporter-like MFS transporter